MVRDFVRYIKGWHFTDLVGVCLITTWLVFVLATAVNTQHIAYNLEPYPDALYFIGTAVSIARGEGIVFDPRITYKPEIAPAYPLVLSIFFHQGFWLGGMLLCNVILGVSGLLALWQLLAERAPAYRGLLFTFFLSHAAFWWIPTLPISENLVWSAVVITLFFLHKFYLTQRRYWLLAVTLGAIVLAATKFSVIPIALTFLGIVTWELVRALRPPIIIASAMSLALFAAAIFHFQVNSFVRLLLSNDLPFFQASHVPLRFVSYLSIMAGAPNRFLWQPLSLTLPLYSLAAGIYVLTQKKKDSFALSTAFVLIAHFPLLFFFYDTNLRYIISVVPTACCMIAIIIGQRKLTEQGNQRLLQALVIAIIGNAMLQAPLFKLLASQTILRSSRAWQYEAAQAISDTYQHAQNKPDFVFTALPPQLFTFYQRALGTSVLRPLSIHQEFISKKIDVWQFSEFSTNLDQHEYITSLLTANKKLWVSNAYVTHSAAVAHNFESISQSFHLTLVKDGCEKACDIFELSLKE